MAAREAASAWPGVRSALLDFVLNIPPLAQTKLYKY